MSLIKNYTSASLSGAVWQPIPQFIEGAHYFWVDGRA
jgi:hypothetical protein